MKRERDIHLSNRIGMRVPRVSAPLQWSITVIVMRLSLSVAKGLGFCTARFFATSTHWLGMTLFQTLCYLTSFQKFQRTHKGGVGAAPPALLQPHRQTISKTGIPAETTVFLIQAAT